MTLTNLIFQLRKFTATTCLVLAAGSAHSQSSLERFEGAARDAWILGRAETMLALSQQVSAFAINTDVDSGVVTLTGTVDSDVNRELAAELVRGVSGVTEVRNELEIVTDDSPGIMEQGQERMTAAGQSLRQWFDRSTTTAEIKTRLIANSVLPGLDITVETDADTVILGGSVDSEAERALAEEIARNAADGRRITNNISVNN